MNCRRNVIVARFPIDTEEDLQQLEKDLEEKEEEIIAIMRRIICPSNINKKICQLFGKQIVMQYNFDGIHMKKPFKGLENINSALFKACMKEGYTFEAHTKQVKLAFKMLKNRYHKAEHVKRKKKIG